MNLEKIVNKEECTDSYNKCPICGSENIEASDSYIMDEFYKYECTCLDCDCQFNEYHKLSYECTEYDFMEILFASIKKFFGNDVNVSVKENNIILINDKEVEIYNDNEYKNLENISRIISLPDSKLYCRYKNEADEDERTKRLLTIRNLLSEHINLNENEIILPDQDNYDDEFEIKQSNNSSKVLEVLTKKSAYESEKDFGHEFVNTIERIGIYRQLCNSEYYFRWM